MTVLIVEDNSGVRSPCSVERSRGRQAKSGSAATEPTRCKRTQSIGPTSC